MAIDGRRGQALVELAIGILVVALVLSGVFAFTKYIIASLNGQRRLRAEAGQSAMGTVGVDQSFSSASHSTTIKVSPMAAEYIFGSQSVRVRESVHMPAMGLSDL